MEHTEDDKNLAGAQSAFNVGLAAELRDLLDAAEAIHMVVQERWGYANGATVDAKSIVEYFKKAVAHNVKITG